MVGEWPLPTRGNQARQFVSSAQTGKQVRPTRQHHSTDNPTLLTAVVLHQRPSRLPMVQRLGDAPGPAAKRGIIVMQAGGPGRVRIIQKELLQVTRPRR